MYNRRKCACANLFNLESSNTCGCDNMSARNRRSCDCDNITSRNRNTCDCDRARNTCGCDKTPACDRRSCGCGHESGHSDDNSCGCDDEHGREHGMPCGCDELFEELTRVSFALDELRLYLDMHPCCTEALEQFCELQKKREAILADYTENCRSVNSYAVNTSDGWSWTDSPMPWKGGKK